MIHTIEWITNTGGCGGLIAVTVFTVATIIYVVSLRWLKQSNDVTEEE
jgi:multisubunit Na+/H+ antiporter MnhB subunit